MLYKQIISGVCPQTHTATNEGKPHGWVWQGITDTKIYYIIKLSTLKSPFIAILCQEIHLEEVMDAA